jgi:hypothetical protein
VVGTLVAGPEGALVEADAATAAAVLAEAVPAEAVGEGRAPAVVAFLARRGAAGGAAEGGAASPEPDAVRRAAARGVRVWVTPPAGLRRAPDLAPTVVEGMSEGEPPSGGGEHPAGRRNTRIC